jgi:hypothetical protein
MQTIRFTYPINNSADFSEGRVDWNHGCVYNTYNYHGGPSKYISEPK